MSRWGFSAGVELFLSFTYLTTDWNENANPALLSRSCTLRYIGTVIGLIGRWYQCPEQLYHWHVNTVGKLPTIIKSTLKDVTGLSVSKKRLLHKHKLLICEWQRLTLKLRTFALFLFHFNLIRIKTNWRRITWQQASTSTDILGKVFSFKIQMHKLMRFIFWSIEE